VRLDEIFLTRKDEYGIWKREERREKREEKKGEKRKVRREGRE
jgi:hypothetical protein